LTLSIIENRISTLDFFYRVMGENGGKKGSENRYYRSASARNGKREKHVETR